VKTTFKVYPFGWGLIAGIAVGLVVWLATIAFGFPDDRAELFGFYGGMAVLALVAIVSKIRELRARSGGVAVEIDSEFLEEFKEVARESDGSLTVTEVIQKCFRIGLVPEKISADGERQIFFKVDGKRVEIPSDIDEALQFFEERITVSD